MYYIDDVVANIKVIQIDKGRQEKSFVEQSSCGSNTPHYGEFTLVPCLLNHGPTSQRVLWSCHLQEWFIANVLNYACIVIILR